MNNLTKSNIDHVEDTELTPIEIALGVDEGGRTTAKKLYEFLELDKSHYSRWIKSNIEENEFAEQNIDFTPFAINGESGGAKTYDYKLSASFAKKLAMGTHNKRGELAKEYFIKLEDKLKKLTDPYSHMSKELQAIFTLDSKQQEFDSRLTKVENNTTIDYSQQEELRTLGTKKVVAILGGNDAPAYKELNKKVFSSFWRDYKRKLNVNSYKNTLVKDFEIARQVIISWQPSKEIAFMIKGCNAQIKM
ncbi:ORF6C domain-containing protein [Clostridium felsineum]|uniref:ORF6C domain-containing protein n=1 Tax=Clostridium felsineum TaxID=36839 RepID=UPI00214D3F2E|nr:ORF6C domain-containing protein [Clostridium felsineum]MCR3760372.1 ORF6C domain-containing protein [Clostridium felsineum]